MQMIFRKKSDIFIPPFNKFNNATLNAIKELGIKIMSSSIMDQYRLDLGSSILSQIQKNRTVVLLKLYIIYNTQLTLRTL